jgi:hypothetical protein
MIRPFAHLSRVGVIAIAAAASVAVADARSISGFGSFRVQDPTGGSTGPYQCLTEDNGAVVNGCQGPVNLAFGLVVDAPGTYGVGVANYWKDWGANNSDPPFSCNAYTYAGTSSNSAGQSQSMTFNTKSQPNTAATVPSLPDGGTLQLICWNVPPGAGIASVNWLIQ